MRNYSKHLSDELYTLFLALPEDAHQTHLFDLLKRGYIEARYKPNYNITREECEELIAKLTRMQEIVERICGEKIRSIGK